MALEHLILPTRDTRNIDLFLQACFWSGIRATRVESEDMALPEGCTLRNTTVHGGSTFCRNVAVKLGGQVLEPMDNFLPTLPFEYRHRQIDLMPLREARDLSKTKFIKPVNDKHFPAGIYASGADVAADILRYDERVLVSDPVVWEVEFRMFIRDYHIQTYSFYRSHSTVAATSEQTEQAYTFCETLLADKRTQLPRAIVVDVGYIYGRGWAVVEANTAVMSGIYDCDPTAVLAVLEYGLA